ncbi:MAG: hypothetical protein M3203_17075 [Actinomycetota bacterium]|nr:hypothetical protein [Actinomycetota bacterium]
MTTTMTTDDEQIVAQYLQAIEASRAAPEGFLDPDKAAPRLAGGEMVAGEDQEGLETVLAESVPGSQAQIRKLEEEFVRVAARYSARRGMTYESWRQAGVDGDVLTRAGIEAPTP